MGKTESSRVFEKKSRIFLFEACKSKDKEKGLAEFCQPFSVPLHERDAYPPTQGKVMQTIRLAVAEDPLREEVAAACCPDPSREEVSAARKRPT